MRRHVDCQLGRRKVTGRPQAVSDWIQQDSGRAVPNTRAKMDEELAPPGGPRQLVGRGHVWGSPSRRTGVVCKSAQLLGAGFANSTPTTRCLHRCFYAKHHSRTPAWTLRFSTPVTGSHRAQSRLESDPRFDSGQGVVHVSCIAEMQDRNTCSLQAPT